MEEEIVCSVCGKSLKEVVNCVEINGKYICNECSSELKEKYSNNGDYVCSFCGKKSDDVDILIQADCGVFICNECINILKSLKYKNKYPKDCFNTAIKEVAKSDDMKCSFCNDASTAVNRIFSTGKVHICDDCIDVCIKTLKEYKSKGKKYIGKIVYIILAIIMLVIATRVAMLYKDVSYTKIFILCINIIVASFFVIKYRMQD